MPGKAARILQQRCPACFGLREWGRPFKEYVLNNQVLRWGVDIFAAEGMFTSPPMVISLIPT